MIALLQIVFWPSERFGIRHFDVLVGLFDKATTDWPLGILTDCKFITACFHQAAAGSNPVVTPGAPGYIVVLHIRKVAVVADTGRCKPSDSHLPSGYSAGVRQCFSCITH